MFLSRHRFASFALSAFAIVALGIVASPVRAQTGMSNGGSTPVPQAGFFGGKQLATAMRNLYETGMGTLASAVYQNTSGTLDFYYQFTPTVGNSTTFYSLTLDSFSGMNTSVAQTNTDIDGASSNFTDSGFAASSASRSNDLNNGGAVTFSFDDPNQTSTFNSGHTETLVVRTSVSDPSAYSFNGGAVLTSDAGSINFQGIIITPLANGSAVGVSANTPEPGSLGLFCMGLVSMGGFFSRRRFGKHGQKQN